MTWTEVSLGEIAEFRNGVNFSSDQVGPGIRIINVGDFGDRWTPEYESLTEVAESVVSSPAARLQDGDILAVRSNGNRDLIGRVMFIENPPPVTHSGFTIRIRPRRGSETTHPLIPRFLAYSLRGPVVRRVLVAKGGGTNISNLSQGILGALPIPLPDAPTQEKVVAILQAYDELIDSNRRRIEVLDQMIREIHRAWLIEFRYPGGHAVESPDSSFGPIPEGWQPTPLGQLLGFHIGGGWGAECADVDHPDGARVIRGTDLPRVRQMDVSSCPARFHSSGNLRKRQLEEGDVILEVSGGGKDQSVGRSLLVSQSLLEEFNEPAMCASFCKLLRPRGLDPVLLYLHLQLLYTTGGIEAFQVQSTGIKNLRFAQLLERDVVVVPPGTTQAAFVDCVRPMLDQIGALGRQNRNLRATRDLLLPRLVSGELDVSGLDIDLGGAAA